MIFMFLHGHVHRAYKTCYHKGLEPGSIWGMGEGEREGEKEGEMEGRGRGRVRGETENYIYY